MLDTEDHVGQERLKFQLEAIGHHIQLLQEEARAEKESTKEMVSDISHQLKPRLQPWIPALAYCCGTI